MTSQGENDDATEASLPVSSDTGPPAPDAHPSAMSGTPETGNAPAPQKVDSSQWPPGSKTFSSRFDKRERPSRSRGNVTPTREAARLQVALRLIWVLAATIVILAGLLATSRWTKLTPSDTTTTFNTIITAIVTLIASAVGFYFGSENKKGNSDSRDGESDE